MQTTASYQQFNDEQLLDILARSKDAMGIYTGEQLYIQFANEQLISLFGKGPEIIGQSLLSAVPELSGHTYVQLLREVWQSGEARNIAGLSMQIDGMPRPELFDLVYFPVLDKAGQTYCILQTVIAVSGNVTMQRADAAREQRISTATGQLLIENQRDIEDRARFRSIMDASPVAMLILRGEQLIFEEVNPVMLLLLNKDASIKGEPLMEVMPELRGQSILNVINDTYQTGKERRLHEERVCFIRDGQLFEGYYNVTYTPLWENGKVTGLLQCASDVTAAVFARQSCQRTEERLQLAVETANMGTFSMHTPSMVIEVSERFRELFGFGPQETLSYESCMNRIGDDFRQAVADQISRAMRTGARVEMKFTVTSHPDQIERWVRGAGTLQLDGHGVGEYFTGIVMEVSEQLADAFTGYH